MIKPSRPKFLLTGFLPFFFVSYLLFWPVDIEPEAWNPKLAPGFTPPFEKNNRLQDSEIMLEGIGEGPEDIAFDRDGKLYTGLLDGRILRIDPGTSNADVYVNTGGRPLGLEFNGDEELIVADAKKGLLKIGSNQSTERLAVRANDQVFGFTNNLDIAEDGMIYFTDSSTKFGFDRVKDSVIEHRPRGRLLRYDPETGKTNVLMNDLYFANGLALSQSENYLLVAETTHYRIRKYWLKGDKKGQDKILIDNMPGFPDNITSASDGAFWVALPTTRNSMIDWMAPYPFLRKILARLPSFMMPKAARYGFVIKIDGKGSVVETLQDPSGKVAYLASAVQWQDELFMGSYRTDKIWTHSLRE